MKINQIAKLLIAIIVCELAGIIGSFFTASSVAGWYAVIAKPALNPPSWLFAPVWTTLFILMGIAAFLVWRKGLERREVKIALAVFMGQLVLNVVWSFIFFGLRSPAGAFIEIIFLWLAILATIILFAKISKPAVWLLLPYILWVSFAGYLNFSIWQLNSNQQVGDIFCTAEAKLCPDGSSVGRVPPNCEFAACPKGENNDLWQTAADSKTGISFQYPEKLTTQYIFTQEWPPVIKIKTGSYSCKTTPMEVSSLLEITSQRLVDNRVYCVNVKNEGAAGSVYSSYVYTIANSGKLIEVNFTLIYPNCGNYDQDKNLACSAEREAFDLDATVDRIVRTIKWDLPQADNSLAEQLAKCLPMSDMGSKEKCDELLKEITDFNSCVAAGFPIMKSNPPQCATPDGRTFFEKIK